MSQEAPGHFDNPVYAFQPPPSQGSVTTNTDSLLRNGGLIKNNLRKPNNTNSYKYSESDSLNDKYSIQYVTESQKNFDADLTNPNLYHCIEDVKDHVYDEIKHKEGYKDLGE